MKTTGHTHLNIHYYGKQGQPGARHMVRCGCLVLCVIMLLSLLPMAVLATENTKTVIRVGSFEGTYNIINENGERSGYGYEYLQNIAGYTGWTYEYVPTNWAECFTQLENGEIDILGGISYTKERAGNMLFSEIPMGEENYYIYVDSANTSLSASNLSSFKGEKIGVLKNHIPETVLSDWEEKYHVRMEHYNVGSLEQTLEMMESRQISCFVSSEDSNWIGLNFLPITNIGKSDIFFAINKNRPDIKQTLDNAMRRIQDDNPFYTDDLYRRYLSSQGSAFLSIEERQWLAQHGNIRIGFLNDDAGVSVLDHTTGEMAGVITDYVRLASDCLQGETLQFELHPYDTRAQQLQALHDDEIDLIFHVSQNPYSAETNGFVLSDTVWAFYMAAITTGKSFNENAVNTVGVPKDNFSLKAYISYNYPQWIIEEFETNEAAVQAMKDGAVDCILGNSGVVSDYLRNKKIHSYFLTVPANASFGIRQGEPVLLSIMNKTLMSMPKAQLSGAVVSYSASQRKVTVRDYLQDNLLQGSMILAVVFLGILVTVLVFLRQSRQAEEKAKQSAARAMELNRQLKESHQQLQTALAEAQSANKAKTTFLNNMSHDIRTPINGIIGMLSILEKSAGNPERAKDCLYKINMSAQLLLSLINDVLDMAKLESDTVILNNETINLDEVCEEVTTSVVFQAENAGLQVSGEHDDYRGVYVKCSAMHLKKVLMNLFTNSIKYNKPNGAIRTSMRTLSRTADTITIQFQIADTGIGMTEEFVKNKLFVPFVQADNSPRTNYVGTGLGMPIVKEIVEKMGGTITVESKLGEGSRFTVVLPFQIDHYEAPVSKAVDSTVGIAGMRLLLVEDNELNAEIAKFMLLEDGATVETAQNGLEALQKFEAAQPGYYDAILMDVMMPVMDGLTATEKIRGLNRPDAKTVPIIAMTANVFREDAEKCRKAGMNAHLSKPVDAENVRKTLSSFYTKL